MKKILLVIFLLTVFNAYAEGVKVIQLNNIDIKIFNESKVQVFKGDVHMFGIDCNNGILCKAFVSHVGSPEYKIFDGVVQSNNSVPLTRVANLSFKLLPGSLVKNDVSVLIVITLKK